MYLILNKNTVEKIGVKKFKPFGIEDDTFNYNKRQELNLAQMKEDEFNKLYKLLSEHKSLHGVGVLVKDMERWTETREGNVAEIKPRSVRQFTELLINYLAKVEGHRIYDKFGDDIWMPYYVNRIEYEPPEHRSGSFYPPHCNVTLLYRDFNYVKKEHIVFYEEDCRGLAIARALARKGYLIETPELREKYLEDFKWYNKRIKRIGKQYVATGTATDDLDGNPTREDSRYWFRQQTNTHAMCVGGEPSRVIVDVFVEKDQDAEKDKGREQADTFFWTHKAKEHLPTEVPKKKAKVRDEDDSSDDEESEDTTTLLKEGEWADADERSSIEVPTHTFMAVFHLRKHLRMKIHSRYLKPYKYEKGIGDKLILPTELRSFVDLLIKFKPDDFNDVVKGKSGGAVVLLSGVPGVGKTLTAEIYAEREKRALYSVQCSQLGVDPEDLEEELLKVFTRAKRWNAILLLDEADVYVRERGGDLNQNAIVGVFLRVLEYQPNVLFLTTNRPEDIDDAIASRCLASLYYQPPTTDDQKKIWRVLADASKINISDETINDIAMSNPTLTGRDVKNLLKLANLMHKDKISKKTVEYVKQFKPVGSEGRRKK